MNNKFKAIVLNQSGDKFSREVKTLDKSFFKSGDVLVKVDYSGLNYKDALILKNGGKLVKEYPHIPGILGYSFTNFPPFFKIIASLKFKSE